MLQWLLLTVLCSAAAVMVSVPFIRRLDAPRPGTENDGKSSTDTPATVSPASPGHRLTVMEIQRLAVSIAGIVVLGSVGLYALTGNATFESPASGRTAASAEPSDAGSDATSDLRKFAEKHSGTRHCRREHG